MRRIQVVMDPELDDWLEREADARGLSKSALVRECVRKEADDTPFDNGLWRIAEELVPMLANVESVDDIDEYLYGSLGQET